MSYQALARKWRPSFFNEVMGQEHVVTALRYAIENNRVHHAFLFTGTRGVGKTTLARLLAKALNCEKRKGSEPCNVCSACIDISNGSFLDLIEIDAASRTRVDDTREILDNVQYAPSQGKFKVYLIDEVHMLSNHSFNALLKTLEEPPAHVKFLLATTDSDKLPATVLSRCLQFNLRVLSVEEIFEQLKVICKAEKIEYDDNGLIVIARAGSGSMRDSLSLLDQSISFGNGNVFDKDVRRMLGMIESNHVDEILRALAESDGSQIINTINKTTEKWIDYMSALNDILYVLHATALYQIDPKTVINKDIELDLVKYLAAKMLKEDLQLYYQIGLMGKRDLNLAPDLASGFEMTIMRMLTFCIEGSGQSNMGSSSDPFVDDEIAEQTQAKSKSSPVLHDAGITTNYNSQIQANGSTPKGINIVDPNNWASLICSMQLSGLTRELAMNLAPRNIEENVLTVSLSKSLSNLYSDSRRKKLEENIRASISIPLKINVVESNEDTVETPVEQQIRQSQELLKKTEDDILKDPAVKNIMESFNATVLPQTISPAKNNRSEE